jgi:hypothetical protein
MCFLGLPRELRNMIYAEVAIPGIRTSQFITVSTSHVARSAPRWMWSAAAYSLRISTTSVIESSPDFWGPDHLSWQHKILVWSYPKLTCIALISHFPLQSGRSLPSTSRQRYLGFRGFLVLCVQSGRATNENWRQVRTAYHHRNSRGGQFKLGILRQMVPTSSAGLTDRTGDSVRSESVREDFTTPSWSRVMTRSSMASKDLEPVLWKIEDCRDRPGGEAISGRLR